MIYEFFKIFAVIFVDELGDKTQLATLGFASNQNKWLVFAASATALIITSLLASLIGGWLQGKVNPRYLSIGAGLLFIVIGAWTIFTALRGK
ncbi:MAG TPA: TMEM165/GDT1 family protein [Candidatus Limnocylindria bacterium]|nr:TMEM165/GDT1 family protein [Candidatus Limnocylindria bacterium]